MRILGIILFLIGSCRLAMAAAEVAPEIDATTGVSALALLGGGVLVLRARRKR